MRLVWFMYVHMQRLLNKPQKADEGIQDPRNLHLPRYLMGQSCLGPTHAIFDF